MAKAASEYIEGLNDEVVLPSENGFHISQSEPRLFCSQ